MKISIDPDKIYTKMAYHKLTGHGRLTIDQHIKKGKLKTLKVNGAVLINAEEK